MVGAFVALLLVYYFASTRSRFQGPVPQGTEQELTDVEHEFSSAATEFGAVKPIGLYDN